MEKIMYLVSNAEATNAEATPSGDSNPSSTATGSTGDQLRDRLINELAPQLQALDNVRQLRMSFDDSAVSAAASMKFGLVQPLPQAVISVWVDTANTQAELLAHIEAFASHIEAYLVCESEVIIAPSAKGQRTQGSVQICSLSQRTDIDRETFLSIWKDSHSQVAKVTQSTFGYRQNLVVRRLNALAKNHTAIVEEHFPSEAMTSQHAFYDAIDATGKPNDAKLKEHQTKMMESCERFIDNNSINVVHMSEYTL